MYNDIESQDLVSHCLKKGNKSQVWNLFEEDCLWVLFYIEPIPFHGYVKSAVLSLKKSPIDPLLSEPYSFSRIQKYRYTV